MNWRCLFGHKWVFLAWSFKTIALGHLSPMAGTRAKCERCGKLHDDLPYGRMRSVTTGKIVNGPDELDEEPKP